MLTTEKQGARAPETRRPLETNTYPTIHAKDESLSPETQQKILNFLHRYGSQPIAYSVVQPGLEYYIDDELGFIGYIAIKDFVFAPKTLHMVIGNPICAPENYGELLDRYLANTDAGTAAFVEIDSEFAGVLHSRGMPVNELGVEWELDLVNFDPQLPGKKFQHLRRWRNKALAEDVQVHEGRMHELLERHADELTEMNQEWLKRKGGHEFIGLTRPMELNDHPYVRYFWATQNGRLTALTVFDPMFKDNEVIGYYHNLSRVLEAAPHGTNDLIVLEAMRSFQSEGKRVLSLGMSPFAEIDNDETREYEMYNRRVAGMFGFMYRHCQFVYPFKGNHFHKRHYRGTPHMSYMASVPALNIYRVLGVFRAAQIL